MRQIKRRWYFGNFIGLVLLSLTVGFVLSGCTGGTTPASTPVTGVNDAPVVSAGANPSHAFPGDTVFLDAHGSHDPGGLPLTFHWTQVSGPPVTIANPDSAVASFFAHSIGTYVFRVTVNNGSVTSEATVTADVALQ